MPQAAFCSQCGDNVFVGEDGCCPRGHPPEALSDYYEAPAAPTRNAGGMTAATAGRSTRSSVKVARILLVLLAVFALATLACCAFGGSLLLGETDELPAGGQAASEEAPSLDPAEQAYLRELEAIEDDVLAAAEQLDSAYPAQDDEGAQAVAESIAVFSASYDAATALQPPPKYQAIHDHFVAGIALFLDAGQIMADNGYRELPEPESERAGTLMIEAADEFQQMSDAADALDVVW